MNNNFRPISLSEGRIFEKNNTLLRKFSKNDLTDIYVKIDEEENNSPQLKNLSAISHKTYFEKENFIEDNSLENNEIIECTKPFNIENKSGLVKYEILIDEKSKNKNNLIPNKKKFFYIIKKLFMFMIHLTLISIFEIIFFFSIISTYENKAITSVIIKFFDNVPNICYNLNYQEKINFTDMFNHLINITDVDANAKYSALKRKTFNYELFINAWMYFLAIIAIDIVLFIIKYIYKIKINFTKLILDNLGMIIILAIYEYMFFKTIILLYDNISQNELIKLIVGQFNSCLV